MLYLKIIITQFILPPGCIIVLLIVAGAFMLRGRSFSAGFMSLGCALFLWGLATAACSSAIIGSLERGITYPGKLSADAIVLLGGGIHSEARDLSGTGSPSSGEMSRLVTAVRAQRMTGLPLIISGGSVYSGTRAEAPVVARIAADLGVPAEKIIVEEKSRDTFENARYSAAICRQQRFRKIILVTSAYHMKRSLLMFRTAGLDAVALPADVTSWNDMRIAWHDFLPSAAALEGTSKALREYLGLFFYQLPLTRINRIAH